MRVRAADTPKYATKQIRSEATMPIGIAFWGFFTSSPKKGDITQRLQKADLIISFQ